MTEARLEIDNPAPFPPYLRGKPEGMSATAWLLHQVQQRDLDNQNKPTFTPADAEALLLESFEKRGIVE